MITTVVLAGFLSAFAQEGTLDVLDGETLFEGGWLFTLGTEVETRRGLRRGSDRVSDPLDRELSERTVALSAHYGLRHDLQLSAILPWVHRELEFDDSSLTASGTGDFAFVAKWRFYRWDEVGKAANFAVIAGLEAPTGEDGETSDGVRLPPELQPGSGSWDASLGAAVTHEPGRWRFNAAVLYQRNGQGSHDFKFGDEFFAELAAGNRFWLEPYPGPFMRFDLLLRYRQQARSMDGGSSVDDSGGEVLTAGATLAFRPRPTIDIQLFLERPLFQDFNGTQLEEDLSILFVLGFRI